MSALQHRFKFPTRLWLVLSFALFLFLFFRADVCYKTDRPTAFGDLISGNFGMCILGSAIWFVVSVCIGAYIAAVFGIFRAFVRKS